MSQPPKRLTPRFLRFNISLYDIIVWSPVWLNWIGFFACAYYLTKLAL